MNPVRVTRAKAHERLAHRARRFTILYKFEQHIYIIS